MAEVSYRSLNAALAERIARYAAEIRRTFSGLSEELVKLAMEVAGESREAEDPFRFDAYPGLSKRAEKIFRRLRQEVYDTIVNAKEAERRMADIDAGAMAAAVLGPSAQSDPAYAPLFVSKPDISRRALHKVTGTVKPPSSSTPPSPPANVTANPPPATPSGRRFDLSGRVWNLAEGFKEEIQRIIDGGIRDGLSADTLSERVRKYLNEPDMLFRRVRDAEGQLRLSKAASAYHPGRGVYRSSYKNARRLARTEINMAYHEQAYTRRQQLDFVVGIRVVLSGAHPAKDICDDLQGEYPKDFKFLGWHPQCMCHTVALVKGEDGEVRDVPDNFRDWVEKNKERIENAEQNGTMPYFLRDNRNAWKDLVPVTEVNPISKPSDGFSIYKEFSNGGRIEIMNGYAGKSDHKDLIAIARNLAEQGKSVQITTGVHYKDNAYNQVFGALKGTKYERKCPDLIVNGVFYEYESYMLPFKKEKVSNMLSKGLKQSSYVIINNNKGANHRYIHRTVFNRSVIERQNIDEVWVYEKGTVSLLYKKQ